eukprot:scaffold193485_cov32-Tisochrysis_lutea.AAC.6
MEATAGCEKQKLHSMQNGQREDPLTHKWQRLGAADCRQLDSVCAFRGLHVLVVHLHLSQ